MRPSPDRASSASSAARARSRGSGRIRAASSTCGGGPYPLVREGETICTITDHFGSEERVVEAPFTGLLVGVLENPVALPGHPLCHLARIDEATREEIEAEIETGEFDGYRANGTVWRAGDGVED